MKKVLADTNLQLLRGFKIILEEVIILSLWTSAILKQNLQSFIDYTLIVLYHYNRTPSTMKTILYCNSVVLVLRLLLALSNMDEKLLSPMAYPQIF